MRIAEVHASMREEISAQGPLVDRGTGQRRRANRGVARRYRQLKRQAAEERNARTLPDRRRSARRQAVAA